MTTRGLSLRSTLAAATLVVVSLALMVSVVLVVLTTMLRRTTSKAAAAVETIRLVQEAEIDLLLHDRATDALVRRDVEERIRRRLSEARSFVTSADEHRTLREVETLIDAYLTGGQDPAGRSDLTVHQEAAYGALETLVSITVTQARQAHSAAAAWDQRANVVGISVSAVLLLGAVGVLGWLRLRAFDPVLVLANAMDRFAKGDLGARVQETGPAELREMSRRFNEMATALAAQRRAQIAFLGGVAHDIRNPLAVVKMALTLVRPDRPLPPEPRLRITVETIGRQLTRLERMAGDFLDMATIEAGELELKCNVHDARGLASSVVDLFREAVPARPISVSVPDEPVHLRCDQLRVEQVLTNLISNAIKYSPDGAPIEVAVEPLAATVIFRVTDQGIGIPEAELDRVFEPFRRASLSSGMVAGVGLGLFVVRRIVELHGGRIDVQSTPGVGSTFRVHLPRIREPGQGS